MLFLLGNTPDLSLAEIKAVVDENAFLLNEKVAQARTETKPSELINRLGGTVKLFEPIKSLPTQIDETNLIEVLTSTLTQKKQTKLNFYVSQIGKKNLPRLDLVVLKRQLQTIGIKVRFPQGKREGLSAANLLHQDIVELNLIYTEKEIILAETKAVQNIDLWTKRDRRRPYTQRRKGMLPLKVARMMVNLATGANLSSKAKLLDPFVGSGSVLMEAGMVNLPYLIGSDNDLEAVKGTRANLNWLKKEFNLKFDFEVHQADATKLQLTTKVDYLVSEPFLGKQTPNLKKIDNLYLGLEKLYLGAFKNWHQLLKPEAKVVIILPAWPQKPKLNFEKLIDKLKKIGYTTSSEPLTYARENATVVRKIWQFNYKG